jgi:hypothetical protein
MTALTAEAVSFPSHLSDLARAQSGPGVDVDRPVAVRVERAVYRADHRVLLGPSALGHQTMCQPMLCTAPAVRLYSLSDPMMKLYTTNGYTRRQSRFLCQINQAVPSGSTSMVTRWSPLGVLTQ